MLAVLQCIQRHARHVAGDADRSQVGLHPGLPGPLVLFGFLDPAVAFAPVRTP